MITVTVDIMQIYWYILVSVVSSWITFLIICFITRIYEVADCMMFGYCLSIALLLLYGTLQSIVR